MSHKKTKFGGRYHGPIRIEESEYGIEIAEKEP